MRFLISRLSALGDTICSLPAASALKRAFPECHLSWVVDPRFAGVVECCAAVDQVVTWKFELKPPKWDEPFDAALDLQGLFKSAYPVLWCRAKQKVGYHWQREGAALVTERILPAPTSFHVVDQYVDVARAIGGQADRAEFNLTPKPEDLQSVKAKVEAAGVADSFVALNPGAGWPTKRWPPVHFARLMDAVSAEGLQCVLIGGSGASDREAAAEVIARCGSKPVDMLGQTSVRELIALISMARAHVGGDTGSTHIAAALGVPAVGLYSITRPQRSCPYGQIERCHYDPSGLAAILPEQVLETVRSAVG